MTPASTRRLRQPGYVLLNGYYFLDHFNVEKHRPMIADQFKLVDRHAENVSACIAKAREGGPILVGIHIRRGDYRTYRQGRSFFNDQQYAQVFTQIETLLAPGNVRFLIASDENIQLENFDRFDCTKSTGHLVEDNHRLAECDMIAGPFSTYSLWASFYGHKKIYFITDPEEPFSLNDFQTHMEVLQETIARDDGSGPYAGCVWPSAIGPGLQKTPKIVGI